ncbi:hypothetical protein EX895_005546 [Sporisorium graminicola]|uniref:Ecp2 effector protein domain-containing protein n=1 Tax=Sporisorium graminicola TaxID=280036 RepID=A0A4U7KMI7_9BASI|nr:hypothetical protein EX895_005546 [Sporisorium graminicola]TKY85384.1 hypothetical protein EX895_005546 [Sporisorium graminicola]
MLVNNTPASVLLLFSCAAAIFSAPTQASSVSYTILVPCGADADNKHAVVPDAYGCQKISNIGAFTIATLGKAEENVRIGFSPTPDCKQTYAPPLEELAQLAQNQTCRSFIVGPNANGVMLDPNGAEAGTKMLAATKRDETQQLKKDEEGSLWKRGVGEYVNGFLRKRTNGEDSAGAGTERNTNTEPVHPSGGPQTDQVVLSYVMLVNA